MCNKRISYAFWIYELASKGGHNMAKTTEVGYMNKNNQKNLGKTGEMGTDYLQSFYRLQCLNCRHVYKANGTDIWQRKCPKCQGGRP